MVQHLQVHSKTVLKYYAVFPTESKDSGRKIGFENLRTRLKFFLPNV